MDEYTNFLWSFFLKHKDDQVQIVIKLIKCLQNETNIMNNFSGVPRSICSLATFYNPDPQNKWENMGGEAAVYVTENNKHETALISTMYDGNPEPWEAINCPDFSNWWETMCTEFSNMEHKQVWEITPKSNIPTGRKIIGSRWILARRDDGCYRARCVAKGFSQIPGKDFQVDHAPVISDTTLHLLSSKQYLS
jgi:Reverse transcriptase (RNA-dependent DNA polymerase)